MCYNFYAPPHRHTVTSSWIKSAGYDAATRTFEAEFADDDVYRYFDMPAKVYERFLSAD